MEDQKMKSLLQRLNAAVTENNAHDEKETVDDHSAFAALYVAEHLEYECPEDVVAGCICLNLLNTYVKQDDAKIGYFFKHYIEHINAWLAQDPAPEIRFSVYKDNGQDLEILELYGIHQFSFHSVNVPQELRDASVERGYADLVWNGIRNQKAAMTLYRFLPEVIELSEDKELMQRAEEYAKIREQRVVREGYMPFLGHETYYRIVGAAYDKPALVLLHGGPGSTHNYFEVLDRLADTGRPIVMYDQLGCGESYVEGHPELWTSETWLEELKTLREYLGLKKIHLLGQSWGGMLAIKYLIDDQPEGICSAILSSTLSSSALWAAEQHRLISFLPEEDQEAIRQAEETGNYSDRAYLAANARYMDLHAMHLSKKLPKCVRRQKRAGTESYLTAWGPNEYSPTGTLKDFDYTDRLGEINVPALVISGTNDLCTPLVAKTLYDGIRQAEWELFPGCRHMVFVEETDRYCRLLSAWMERYDG